MKNETSQPASQRKQQHDKEREREVKRERGQERGQERERECVCVLKQAEWERECPLLRLSLLPLFSSNTPHNVLIGAKGHGVALVLFEEFVHGVAQSECTQ